MGDQPDSAIVTEPSLATRTYLFYLVSWISQPILFGFQDVEVNSQLEEEDEETPGKATVTPKVIHK